MRKQSWLASIGLAALTVIAACGGPPQGPDASPGGSLPSPEELSGTTLALDTIGPACAEFPKDDEPGSLTAMANQPAILAASTNASISTFVAAVTAAGLAQELDYDQRAATIFVPDNRAFHTLRQALGQQRYNALLADKAALTNLLKSHVVFERNTRKNLLSAGTATTLAGSSLRFNESGSTMTVADASGNRANVVCGNIPTQNAILYIVDKVLTPTGRP